MKTWIERHSLVSYFALAYGITWGGILVFLASKGFQTHAIQTQDLPILLLFMLLGPSVAGLGLTWLLDRPGGIHELWLRLTHWRVGLNWYAVALLANPALTIVILTLLTILISPAFAPGFAIIGLVIGLVAGFVEELGWTGFATPRLLSRNNVLTAGLVLGVLWAVWHLLADFSGNFSSMGMTGWVTWFVTYWLLPLTAYRILMTWVYANTRSLMLAQLMHASWTGWQFALSPATSTDQTTVWHLILAVALWGLVFLVIVIDRKQWVGAHLAPAGGRV